MKENVIKKANEIIKKKENIWVFFDEINTSTCMGIITEIMCNKTMRGEKLPENIIYFAACNPYKRKTEKALNTNFGLVFKKDFKNKDLVYNVLPLIHSLINFIYDFGYLQKEDEKSYIKSIVRQIGKNKKNENEIYKITFNDVENAAIEMLAYCQNFIRENNEISSVSLRDTRRFSILFEWFMKLYDIRIEIKDPTVINITDKEKQLKSVILGLYLCYILRIPEPNQRNEVYNELFDIYFQKCPDEIFKDSKDIINFIDEELKTLINRIIIDKGIAKNTALKENIFALFNCIMNYIPIFICGKPGCSKTLSLELLRASLNGNESLDNLFKKVPALNVVYFQGSRTSTSKEIENAFESAYKSIKKDYISLLFFDEMGLAEISDNNPLKILHSKLEYEDEAHKVSFVGVSNWSLDASKQNRGIFIVRPDPSKFDLTQTANVISKSYKVLPLTKINGIISDCYIEYKKILKEIIENNKDNDKLDLSLVDFHGTRDFYNMIKQFTKKLKNISVNDNKKIMEIAKDSLDRNFSGLTFANIPNFRTVSDLFIEKTGNYDLPKYNLVNSIKNNIEDFESRYLILIANNEVGSYLIDNLFKENKDSENINSIFNTKPIYYYGSSFKNDLEKEEYSYIMVNKIMVNMEQGNFLVLKNLDIIYPSLFDLFNQHFVSSNNPEVKYCRISIGLINNPRAEVNYKFKIVVLIDKEDSYYQDPPFLNRFEKHYLDFDTLLNESDKKVVNLIKEFLEALITIDKEKIPNNKIILKDQLLNCDIDEISGILYKLSRENPNLKKKEKSEQILETISKTFSEDIILYSKFNYVFNDQNVKNLLDDIYLFYNKHKFSNFINFVENITSKKYAIYTFTKKNQKINLKNIKIQNKKMNVLFTLILMKLKVKKISKTN